MKQKSRRVSNTIHNLLGGKKNNTKTKKQTKLRLKTTLILKSVSLRDTVGIPVATERTSSESSFTRGLKEVLLSPLTPPPPPIQRDGYRSCSRSSGPLWRRTRKSDRSSAWMSNRGTQRNVSKGSETKLMSVCVRKTQRLTYLLIFANFPGERTFMNHSLCGKVEIL